MQSLCVTIQMKAIEKYFRALLFLALYKLIVTFKTAISNFVKYIPSLLGALQRDSLKKWNKVGINF